MQLVSRFSIMRTVRDADYLRYANIVNIYAKRRAIARSYKVVQNRADSLAYLFVYTGVPHATFFLYFYSSY